MSKGVSKSPTHRTTTPAQHSTDKQSLRSRTSNQISRSADQADHPSMQHQTRQSTTRYRPKCKINQASNTNTRRNDSERHLLVDMSNLGRVPCDFSGTPGGWFPFGFPQLAKRGTDSYLGVSCFEGTPFLWFQRKTK